MATDMTTACAVLRASGLTRCALLGLWFPFGRERRTEAAARKRHAVLEAKNAILDVLSRAQKPLVELGLRTAKHARFALRDPEQRKLILGRGLNQAMLAEEAERYGVELGPSFTQALVELVQEGRAIRLADEVVAPGGEIYLLVHLGAEQRYDLGPLNRLLHKGEEYGVLLRERERIESERDAGRTYRMDA